MSSQFDTQKLADGLRGELIEPEHPSYEAARKVYNAMIDKRPRMIARCADAADVILAVNFARENDLTLSVRGGGHSGPGLGVCDDALTIDLSPIHGVRVDPKARTVRVGGGATWGAVDHATHPFGLAAVSGIISTTGVGGLTLGGGHGYLTRRYGLTIDNLLEADVVLADGRFVHASPKENDDLFWAIRGGGGNFGVVTSFLFRLHPVHTIYGGPMFWPKEQAAEILTWYADFLPNAPEDVYGFFAFLNVPPGPPFPEPLHGRSVCGIVWCYTGPMDKADKALEPVRKLSKPLFEHVGPAPFPMLQRVHDPFFPPGLQWYWKGDFVREIGEEAVAQHVKYGTALPTMHSTMHLYPVDGAVHRVRSKDTAWTYRDITWSQVIVGVDPDPANNERTMSWARDYWEALHPYSAGAAYINFMMEETPDRIRATYRGNYERLVEVKKKYDPTNLFHVNQNIRPDDETKDRISREEAAQAYSEHP